MKIEKIPLPPEISPPEIGGVPSGGVVRSYSWRNWLFRLGPYLLKTPPLLPSQVSKADG